MTEATLWAIDAIRRIRRSLDAVVDELPPEAWLTIPDGFRNNVLWNVGHVAVTAELLTYGLAGLDLNVSPETVAAFRKGSSPAAWEVPPDIAETRRLLAMLPDQLEADYRAGRFEAYQPYTTTPGVTLTSVDEGIAFDLFHEGLPRERPRAAEAGLNTERPASALRRGPLKGDGEVDLETVARSQRDLAEGGAEEVGSAAELATESGTEPRGDRPAQANARPHRCSEERGVVPVWRGRDEALGQRALRLVEDEKLAHAYAEVRADAAERELCLKLDVGDCVRNVGVRLLGAHVAESYLRDEEAPELQVAAGAEDAGRTSPRQIELGATGFEPQGRGQGLRRERRGCEEGGQGEKTERHGGNGIMGGDDNVGSPRVKALHIRFV